MASPILRYSAGGPVLRTVTPPAVTTFTTETEEESVNPANPTPILDYAPGGGAPVPPWPPSPEDLTYPECGTIQLVSGQSWIDVTFAYEKPDTEWIFEDLQVVNTTDPTPLNIWPGIVTVKSVTGFTLQLNGLPNTDNYFLHWAVGGCATSDWVVSPGITATNFLQLTDTPDEYTGQAGMGVKVNEAEDGLEFGVVGSGGGDVINVLDYGAVADCVTLFDITMPNGNVVTSAAHTFVEADIGKWAIIRGATDSGGHSPLIARITAVSGNTATLDTATTTALTNIYTDSFPRMDFGTDNTIPIVLACLAVPGPGNRNYYSGTPFAGSGVMNPILPGDGGTVYIPRGRYLMINGYPGFSGTSFWWIETNNLVLKGDGMGQTVIFQTSDPRCTMPLFGAVTFGHGLFQNWILSDYTIYDLNYFTGSGSGMNVRGVDNLLVQRIESCNSRGNCAINYQGYPTSGTPLNNRIAIKDCWIHGNVEDGYSPTIFHSIEGDGLNVGEVRDVHIENNTIEGTGRHAYEGGGNCQDQYFIGNTIDMLGGGGSGINPTGGSTTLVMGNTIKNVGSYFPVDFTVDVGSPYVANDIRVIGNYMQGSMQAGMRFQNTSTDTTVRHIDRVLIANNWVISSNPSTEGVLIGGGVATQAMNMMIEGNFFDCPNAILDAVAGVPPDAETYIIVRNNFTRSFPIGDNLHSGNVIADDNISLDPQPRYGSYWNAGIDSNNVLAGAIYSNYSTGVGYRTTDSVEIVRGTTTAPSLIIWGVVTAADTVTTYAFNPTGGTLNTGAETMFIVRRRLPL